MNRKGFITPLIIIILIIAALIGGYVYVKTKHSPDKGYGVEVPHRLWPVDPLCTQEAKQCPDGSYVSRQGPKCEFAACPNERPAAQSSIPANWKTYRNEKYGFEMKYPENMIVRDDNLYDSTGKNILQGRYTVGILEEKYSRQIEGEVPQLIIANYKYGNLGRDSNIFTEADKASDHISADIHFQQNSNDLIAKCIIPDEFKAGVLSGISLCNKILSTFKFTK